MASMCPYPPPADNKRRRRSVNCAARTNRCINVFTEAHGALYGFASLFCVLMLLSTKALAEPEQNTSSDDDDHVDSGWKYHARLSKFERQLSTDNDDQNGEWAAFLVMGKEPNAFWLTTKGETERGVVDSAEIRLFYSYTIAPYIGVHLGWRRDIEPEPKRDWLGFGLLGVLPYKIAADISIFAGESDRLAARLEIAYKYWITQKLSLTPDLEANFYSKTDTETDTGSGLSDLDLGLRLRYRLVEGVSPYAGITWKGNFATTRDIIEGKGEDSSDLRFLLGVTLWF